MALKRGKHSADGSFDFSSGGLNEPSTRSLPSRSAPSATGHKESDQPVITASGDSLSETVRQVTDWADAHGIPLIRGFVDEDASAALCLVDIHEPDGVLPFLETVVKLAPTAVILFARRLSDEDLQEVIADLQESGAEASVLGAAIACQSCIGHVANLSVDVFAGNTDLILRFYLEAHWHDAVYAVPREMREVDRDPEQVAFEAERKLWTHEKKQETARTVASDARFGKCKKEQDRLYVLREVLGSEAPHDEFLLKEVARAAKVIYDFEFKGRSG